MRLSELLFEKLTPSQYREYVKAFVRDRYSDIFNTYKKSWQKNNYRIYIPFDGKTLTDEDIHIPSEVNAVLAAKNVKIDDYVQGYGIDEHGRKVKLGKVLQDYPSILQKFVNDFQRKAAKTQNFYAVISRHPYDIAGASTDRGWTSCLNLNGGCNKEKVIDDVKDGTLVAYCVKEDDKDIKKPLGRIRIHPYINDDDIQFGREYTEYGALPNEFMKVVDGWINEVNQQLFNNKWGQYKKPTETYTDSADKRIIKLPKTLNQEVVNALDTDTLQMLMFERYKTVSPFLTKELLVKVLDSLTSFGYNKLIESDYFKDIIKLLYDKNVDNDYMYLIVYNTLGSHKKLQPYGFKIYTFEELLQWVDLNASAIEIYTNTMSNKQLYEIFAKNPTTMRYMTKKQIDILVNEYTDQILEIMDNKYEFGLFEKMSPEQQEIIIQNIIGHNSRYYGALIYMDSNIVFKYADKDARLIKYINDLRYFDAEKIGELVKKNINVLMYMSSLIDEQQKKKIFDIILELYPNMMDVIDDINSVVYTFLTKHSDLLYKLIVKFPVLQPYFMFYEFEYRKIDKDITNYMMAYNDNYHNILNLIRFIEDNDNILRMRIQGTEKKCLYSIKFMVSLKEVEDLDTINVVSKDEKNNIVVVELP